VLDQVTEIPLAGRAIGVPAGIGAAVNAAVTLPAFVAGPENRLVASTFCRLLKAESFLAHGVAPAPSLQLPRILSLFGRTGTGKTHLARGLVRHWQGSQGEDSAVYLTAQDFRQQFHEAININAIGEFRSCLRSRVLLAVDDLHQLPNDPHLMQELRHAMDAMYDEGCTLLVTSNRPVTMLANLPPDVRSRLTAGLMLQLSPPASEARMRIVRHISSVLNRTLPNEIVERLADGLNGTASQLFRALFELGTEQPRNRTTGDIASDIGRSRQHSLREIVSVVAKYYKLSQKELKSRSRKRSAVLARATVVALARELTSESYQQIGHALGRRDHTTIMHNCQKIERDRQRDLIIQETLDDLRRILLSR
jgi:chromosomal replication initiator protein